MVLSMWSKSTWKLIGGKIYWIIFFSWMNHFIFGLNCIKPLLFLCSISFPLWLFPSHIMLEDFTLHDDGNINSILNTSVILERNYKCLKRNKTCFTKTRPKVITYILSSAVTCNDNSTNNVNGKKSWLIETPSLTLMSARNPLCSQFSLHSM